MNQASYRSQVKQFRVADDKRATWMLANTLLLHVGLWAAMIWSLQGPYWVTLLLTALNGGIVARLFIINHDCGHGSFFKSRRVNEIVGFWTGMLAATPYKQWRYGHALHHAKCGKVEDRGVGYFWIMTLQEYQASSKLTQFGYRLYRNPFILFTLGGFYLFIIEFRFALGSDTKEMRQQVWLTNLTLAAMAVGLGSFIGFGNFFLLWVPMITVAATFGLWLFYLQHHYEDSYWESGDEWSYEAAALDGSSYIKMPRILEWFSGSINYHHIHHLVPKVPCYRLREAHEAIPAFNSVEPLSWDQIAGSWRLRLVDETTMKWVDFPKS